MTKQKYFTNLDTIRFIAATMVYLQHGISTSFSKIKIDAVFKKIIDVICDGGTGVSVFFVLSGFLITYLLLSEYEKNHDIDLKKFYMRRILRIWPLYYSVVLFSFVIYPLLKSFAHLNHPLGSNILYYISFLSNFDVINIEKHNIGNNAMSQSITWSVSVEEQFYLFWPLIFKILPKKTWIYCILLVLSLSLLFRLININDVYVLYFHTLSVLIDLAVGGLFAIMIKQNKVIRNYFESVDTKQHMCFFLSTIILLFSGSLFYLMPYGRAYYRLLTAVFFAFIIASQALSKNNSVLNLSNFTFANKYGKYTYGIYLLHPIIITLLDVSTRILKIETKGFYTSLLLGITGFIFTLLISKLSYEKFESRFLKIKDRKFAVMK